jgi:hypothetical protein
MWAFRICIERMSQERFFALDVSDHPHDRIQNCGILQYTRQDPVSGAIVPYANWMRSICPHDMSLSSNEWVGIERPRYSDQDLLDLVAKTPRMIEG